MLVLKKSYTNCATEIENTCLLQNQFHNGLKSPCCSDFSKKNVKDVKDVFPCNRWTDSRICDCISDFNFIKMKNLHATCNQVY